MSTILLSLLMPVASAAGIGLSDVPHADLSLFHEPAPPLPEAIPIMGPWRLVGSVNGVRSYEAQLPVRPRVLFFTTAPAGMKLMRAGHSVRHAGLLDERGTPGTWEFSERGIVVRVGPLDTRPVSGEFKLVYPPATRRELALHPSEEQANDPRWFVQTAQVDDVTRRGLYLPAPSSVTWNVDVPAGGTLRLSVGILPPEIDDRVRSDGANVEVLVGTSSVATFRAEPGRFEVERVSLDAWAGQTVRLTLRTSDDDPVRDHVFLGEPQVYVPTKDPRRVLLLFADTLRRDHLGTYGYERAPAPGLDALAAESVVFEDARSVAPWTLPSTRSLLTGHEPEAWGGVPTLAERLSAEGWATAAYVGNVYLSSNFEMAGGWGEHGCVNWPPADMQVDRSIAFLDAHPDQDALVMTHLMDLHLPYKEPLPYMWLYAGAPPEGLGLYFSRTMLLRLPESMRAQLRQYLMDRYDQNLRYVDDALQRLIRAAGDNATIFFFSDHGEEFFDHGDLEHGHTLYEELLRIPMFLRAPGLAPRRVSDPVSLVDLTPTVLDLLGLPFDGMSGRSLLPQSRGEVSDPGRAVAFGRPLYGEVAWGAVRNGQKYVSREGAEQVFDLAADPLEEAPVRASAEQIVAGRDALADATGYDVRVAYRVGPSSRNAPGTPFKMRVPGGIERAWVGDDPTDKSSAIVRQTDDETVLATFTGMYGIQREVFVVPRRPVAEVTPEVTIGFDRPAGAPLPLRWIPPGPTTLQLGKVTTGGRGYAVSWGVLPLPVGRALVGADAEMNAALQAIGYLTDDRAPADDSPPEE